MLNQKYKSPRPPRSREPLRSSPSGEESKRGEFSLSVRKVRGKKLKSYCQYCKFRLAGEKKTYIGEVNQRGGTP